MSAVRKTVVAPAPKHTGGVIAVVVPTPRNAADEGRSLLRVLRPALLGAALTGSLPLAVTDGRWRLRSAAAVRNVLLNLILLGLLATSYVTQPPNWGHITSALDVYVIVLGLDQLLRCVGAVLWAWASAGRLHTLFVAFADYEGSFGGDPLTATLRYVRWFVAYQVISFVFLGTVAVMTGLQAGHSACLSVFQTVFSVGAYGSFAFWIIIFSGMCCGLTDMFRNVTELLRKAAERGNVPLLRSLVHRHGRISELCNSVCHTFGGFVAVSMYLLILEVSLAVYFGLRPTKEVNEDISLVLRVLSRVLTPSSLILLKLTTNAGHSCKQESCRAAELLHSHLRSQLYNNSTPEAAASKAELTELYRQLKEQNVQMSMAGYFTLDRQFFVQSIKDFVTLIIAAVQFDMPFLLNQ